MYLQSARLEGNAATTGARLSPIRRPHPEPCLSGPRPRWLTFDCYGTLIQWDEGLLAAVADILRRRGPVGVTPSEFVRAYDRHEHDLEQGRPSGHSERSRARACA